MAAAPEPASISPLDVVRVLRSAGSSLLTQAGLHSQLARVEWVAEKSRILSMLVAALVAVVGLVCTLLMAGVIALAFSWETRFRIPVAIGVIFAYAAIAGFAWYRLKADSARGRDAFAGTREEIRADVALIRSRL
jgi:uncharacterized membrane protein YqjE